jgi:hypothetical protein
MDAGRRERRKQMIAKFLTKVLPYDGSYVYYNGEKMTPQQAAQCVYVAVATVAVIAGVLLLAL